MTMTAAKPPANGGGRLARGARTRTQSHCARLLSTFRGADAAKTCAIHGALAEAKTAMLIGWPVLML